MVEGTPIGRTPIAARMLRPPVHRLPRRMRRLLRDPFLPPALALLIPVWLVSTPGGRPPLVLVVLSVAFVAIQLAVTLLMPRRAAQRVAPIGSVVRWGSCVVLLGTAQAVIGDSAVLVVAYLPVIGLAASQTRAQAVAAVAITTGTHMLVELVGSTPASTVLGSSLGYGSVATVAALIIRLQVERLQAARDRLRRAVTDDRRRARQIGGVEAIGRILASSGPTVEALDAVVERISGELGYRYVTIYLGHDRAVHLGAQRGYGELIDSFDGTQGIVGRVMRTHRPVLVRDVTADPDYRALNADVRSEICVPLLADGGFLGFVNVESTVHTLDGTDLRAVVAIADRLAAAIILGRERQELAARVELFRNLHALSETINSSLGSDELDRSIVEAVRRVVPADITALHVLDRETGRYVLRAIAGAPEVEPGSEIRVGDGMAGRVIRDRALVIDTSFRFHDHPVRESGTESAPMQAAAVPLIRDGVVVGALTVMRRDADKAFGDLERDALALIAEHASLAVANGFLHAELADLAVRDPLTGLLNRRGLEPAIEQVFAQRLRLPETERPPLSTVIFDLDRFSDLNNRYGHQVGDRALRIFADTLRSRLRASDLVARTGGEEFAAILYRSSLDDAIGVAEAVREAFAAKPIRLDDGTELIATVSAGCAGIDAEKETSEALLRAADVALYMAKRAGRNRVVAA